MESSIELNLGKKNIVQKNILGQSKQRFQQTGNSI